MQQQKRPTKTVSFSDLEALGFTIYVTEFNKELPGGISKPAVKVVKVTKKNARGQEVDFPRSHMQELLFVLGIDTYESKWWVVPKKSHRAQITKSPVVHYRYMGYERNDKDWLQSGNASTEVILGTSRMKDMQSVTDRMARGGDSD